MPSDSDRSKPTVVLAAKAHVLQGLEFLEAALFSAGYHVVIARSESETLEKVRVHRPDAIVLDKGVSQNGYALCTTLRAAPAVSPATPVIMSQVEPPTPADELEALHAGAWHVEPMPPNSHTLLARLGHFLEAKLEVDRLTSECLIDRPSGLYNSHGFLQRAVELGALTRRQGVPSACAVFRPATDLPARGAFDRLGRAFKAVGRLSDAIGRTSATEFAVFAPATNDWAASRLVRRVRDNVALETRVSLHAAYSAATPTQKVEPHALLERARKALPTE